MVHDRKGFRVLLMSLLVISLFLGLAGCKMTAGRDASSDSSEEETLDASTESQTESSKEETSVDETSNDEMSKDESGSSSEAVDESESGATDSSDSSPEEESTQGSQESSESSKRPEKEPREDSSGAGFSDSSKPSEESSKTDESSDNSESSKNDESSENSGSSTTDESSGSEESSNSDESSKTDESSDNSESSEASKENDKTPMTKEEFIDSLYSEFVLVYVVPGGDNYGDEAALEAARIDIERIMERTCRLTLNKDSLSKFMYDNRTLDTIFDFDEALLVYDEDGKTPIAYEGAMKIGELEGTFVYADQILELEYENWHFVLSNMPEDELEEYMMKLQDEGVFDFGF